jgi:hypothetical protein
MKKTAKPPAKKQTLSTKGKAIIGGTALVFVAIGVYLAKDKLFPKKIELPTPPSTGASKPSAAAPSTSTGASKPSAATAPSTATGETLAMGSRGANVIRLQQFLNEHYVKFFKTWDVKEPANPLLETKTGVFGAKTEAELEKQFGRKAITVTELDEWIKVVKADGEILAKQA